MWERVQTRHTLLMRDERPQLSTVWNILKQKKYGTFSKNKEILQYRLSQGEIVLLKAEESSRMVQVVTHGRLQPQCSP